MARIPYAAETLRDQVLSAKPRSKVERHGDADGFRVIRSLAFSKAAANWLEPLLEIIEDPRITSAERDDEGRLIVTFSSRTIADDRTPFPLGQVEQVLKGS